MPPSPSLPPPPRDELEARLTVARAEAALFGGEPERTAVGRFELRRRIGRGGLGTVYAAWDPTLAREVALKVVRPDRAGGTGRMLEEAQAMARLSHPNVVAIHEAGEHDDDVFLAMELVRGSTLRQWLAASTRTPPEVLEAFERAAKGLAAAHEAGLVHRDFKPDNVLVRDDGRVQVADFGLAATLDDDAAEGASGTLPYMAPEQHAGERVGPAADQYALSVALFEALTGEHPFAGHDVESMREAKAAGRVETPTRHVMPKHVARALTRGMDPDPAARFESVGALMAAIRVDPAQQRRRIAFIVVATVFLGIVLVGAVFQAIVFSDYIEQARAKIDE